MTGPIRATHTNVASTPGCEDGGMSPAGGRPAAFFDLDKTIIAKSSALAVSRSFYEGGLINRRTVLKTAYAQFVFSLAGGLRPGRARVPSVGAQAAGLVVVAAALAALTVLGAARVTVAGLLG